jgi:hypothetical protein
MSGLEARARWLLRAYPPAYRADRGEEILGTLLAATPPGRDWPAPREALALVAGGLGARAAQNRQQPVATGLRLALLLAASLWLAARPLGAMWASHDGTPLPRAIYAASALLLVATVAAPWFAGRRVTISLALVSAVALGLNAYYRVYGPEFRWGAALFVVPPLALAAVVVVEPVRPPRCWLWMPGSAFIASALFLLQYLVVSSARASSIAGIAATVIEYGIVFAILVWLTVDARPAIALVILAEGLVAPGLAIAAAGGSRLTGSHYAALVVPLAVGGLAIVRLRRKPVL